MASLIKSCCLCGSVESETTVKNDVHIFRCLRCGLERLDEPRTEAELNQFYQDNYHQQNIYTHDYEHDLEVARKRLKDYALAGGSKLLDVGCGNGAFVVEARKKNIEAVGCDMCKGVNKDSHIYEGTSLVDVHFPTDHFDVVTCHDVLEHVVDPMSLLREIFRVVREDGVLLLDIPRFHSIHGRHHWRPDCHLWYFKEEHIVQMLRQVGFVVKESYHPIRSKTVFYCTKPVQVRPTILVPPGVGDIYWPMVKMQAFLKHQKLGLPNVDISSTVKAYDRSIEYLRRIPFVKASGYFPHPTNIPIFKEAYQADGRTIYSNFLDHNWFMAYNGILRWGWSLEEVDVNLECNWFPPMFISLEERRYGQELKEKIGPYTILYAINHGVYQKWLEEFPIDELYETLRKIAKKHNHKIVLLGAAWDKDHLEKKLLSIDRKNIFHNLVGQTTLEQAFGVIRSSEGMIGFPSGLSMMSVVFRKPTLMLWQSYFHPNFYYNAVPPQARDCWYIAQDTSLCSVNSIVTGYECLQKRANKDSSPFSITGYGVAKPHWDAQDDVQGPSKDENGGLRGPGLTSPPASSSTSEKKSSFQHIRSFIGKDPKINSIVCVLRTGGDYTKKYVEVLASQVSRHMKDDYEFVCLSDDVSHKIRGVNRLLPLFQKWPGMWSKIEIFRQGLFSKNAKVLYLDLDTVVLKDLDPMFESFTEVDEFWALHGFNPRRLTEMNSAIMMFRGEGYEKIHDNMKRDEETLLRHYDWWSEQDFIHSQVRAVVNRKVSFLQDKFPIRSFKRHCLGCLNGSPPEGVSIVCFHGEPRPETAAKMYPWVQEAWR